MPSPQKKPRLVVIQSDMNQGPPSPVSIKTGVLVFVPVPGVKKRWDAHSFPPPARLFLITQKRDNWSVLDWEPKLSHSAVKPGILLPPPSSSQPVPLPGMLNDNF